MQALLRAECAPACTGLGDPANDMATKPQPASFAPNRLWVLGPGGYLPLALYTDVDDDLVDYVCNFLPERFPYTTEDLHGAARLCERHFPEHADRAFHHAWALTTLKVSPSCWFFFNKAEPRGTVLSAAGLAIVLATIDRPNLIRFDWIKANWRFVTENLGIP